MSLVLIQMLADEAIIEPDTVSRSAAIDSDKMSSTRLQAIEGDGWWPSRTIARIPGAIAVVVGATARQIPRSPLSIRFAA
ncbi:hypothetical protein L485_16215 [Sphingobium baderi LL03]|uniref:Uncharacterized protein n=1 Tax=Sphingobium baderi LL03 TaxID=1114964 RepID=T0G5X0_9SPHN|nr:hypothetical protein L485_16215 [Sphingobium baderi LL03]